MSDPFQQYLGIKMTSVIAGFLGGLVKALMTPGTSVTQALISTVIGAIVAGYLTPVAERWSPITLSAAEMGSVSFVIGLAAMLICGGIINAFSRWRDNPSWPTRK